MQTDVTIVGAGPAGAMAAQTLANAGIHTALVERQLLPRAKPCGGLMPAGILSLFNWDISSLIRRRVQGFNFFNNYEDRVERHSSNPLVLVDRAEFDHAMVEKAVQLGKGCVELHTEFDATSIKETSNQVRVEGRDGRVITSRHVIIASGAKTRLTSLLGLNPGATHAAAIDAELQVHASAFREFAETLQFNYFCLDHGYGWIFPKHEGVLSCGVAHWGAGLPLKTELDSYLQHSLNPQAVIARQQQGHPIPIYTGPTQLHTQRVCVCGDAGSLVDPVTGEGIRYALLSGQGAANSVIKAMQKPATVDLSHYQHYVDTQLTPPLAALQRFLALPFAQAPDFFYRRFISEDSGINAYHSMDADSWR